MRVDWEGPREPVFRCGGTVLRGHVAGVRVWKSEPAPSALDRGLSALKTAAVAGTAAVLRLWSLDGSGCSWRVAT